MRSFGQFSTILEGRISVVASYVQADEAAHILRGVRRRQQQGDERRVCIPVVYVAARVPAPPGARCGPIWSLGIAGGQTPQRSRRARSRRRRSRCSTPGPYMGLAADPDQSSSYRQAPTTASHYLQGSCNTREEAALKE